MTDLPAQTDDLPVQADNLPTSTNTDIIHNLRLLFAKMDDRRQELVAEGNIDAIVNGAADVSELMDDLSALRRQAQADVAKLMAANGEKKREVPGVGLVEVKGGSERKNWKSRDVLREVIFRALYDPETGEARLPENADPIDVAKAVEVNVASCLGMTGSTSWKVGKWSEKNEAWDGGLRSLGLEPEDYCDEVPKPNLAVIPKRKPINLEVES